ncbi:MAG: succinylglutamate desuccinylase/aspartoacylase family protein [bacterium]
MRFENYFIDLSFRSLITQRKLAVLSAKAAKVGPVVWLTAGVHGDEIGGVVVIQEIFKRLREQPLRRGTVCALPLINPFGFEVATRQVPISEEDLNRAFPGKASGTLAERIAHLISTTIMASQPTVVLDLHNDWSRSIPYVLIDPKPRSTTAKVYDQVKLLSASLAMPVVLDSDVYQGTLSYTMLRQGVAAFSLELGESYVINEKNIEVGVKALWSVFGKLGMVESTDGERSAGEATKILHYSDEPRISSIGITRFLVKPGETVATGQGLAEVYDVMGNLQEKLKAKAPALVLGHTDYSVCFPGTPLVSLGVKR